MIAPKKKKVQRRVRNRFFIMIFREMKTGSVTSQADYIVGEFLLLTTTAFYRCVISQHYYRGTDLEKYKFRIMFVCFMICTNKLLYKFTTISKR